MEEADFKLRFRAVKFAESKVKECKKKFLAVNVTNMDVTSYEARLEKIRDKLEDFEDVVIDLVLDLDESDQSDKVRIESLDTAKDTLQKEILVNETEVKEKIKELLATQPLSKVEQESIDLKKKQLENQEEEKKIAKVEKKTKVEIDIEDVSSRASALMETLLNIKQAKELTDLQVRENLAESKKWESKFEDIATSKVKIDKEVVGLI